ncbi:MAG: LytTR family DNA-binding domain-containing protein [Clostridium sp.]|nr:LytTR family DNA-binding domain-containing protein [Clostridium sp.]
MVRIAIVDDEQEQIDLISGIVSDFFNERSIDITINRFMSGEALLSEIAEYNLIFLDIQMDGIDGIETAQRLRVTNKKAVLFYITSFRDYIQKSMTIHPFAFIVKPYSEEEVIKNLKDYLEYEESINKNNMKDIFQTNTLNGHYVSINMNDISYFHYLENRTVELVTTTDQYKIKDSLMNIYNKLNHKYFIISNQSFIVNLYHIREIDGINKTIIMKNDAVILIPRRKYNDIIESLNRLIAYEGE